MKSIKQLKSLWEQFGNTPIDESECIDEPFLHFSKGTDRYHIWHWFENQNPEFSVGKTTEGLL